jgi:hypothetical protein
MPSTTIKRTAATLSVLAGLLAAAAPASAQILDGPVLAKAGPLRTDPGPAPISSKVEPVEYASWGLDSDLELLFDAKSAKEGLYFDGSNKQSAYPLRPAAVQDADMAI